MATSAHPEALDGTRRGHLQIVRSEVSGLLAHDLKTPLAALAMNLDFALSELGPDAPASVRGALEDCLESNQRAVGIVTDMVDAIRLTSGQERPLLGPVDVQSRLAGAVRRLAGDAASRGVHLLWSAEPASMRGSVELLDRALDRLLDRALRQARGGDSIDVTLADRTVVIRVAAAQAGGDPPGRDASVPSLATHFADAAMRVQGGAVWAEADAEGALLFVVALPS
jgi:signal transduction histidine kinase